MILSKFLITYVSFYILPAIFLIKKYPNTNKSIILIFSLLASFLLGWFLFLLGFYSEIDKDSIFQFLLIFDITLILYLYKYRDLNFNIRYELNWLTLSITLLVFSMVIQTGSIFYEWDAVVSWNRWAEELSDNIYKPFKAAYPILFPAIWSVFYKIQGTSEINWTVKTLLYVVPIYLSFILYFLYKETNNRIYVLILLSSMIFLLHRSTTSGMVDMPVMLFGLLSFISIIAFEDTKLSNHKIFFLIASILFAGLASITKQAGLYFLIMNLIYFLFFSSGTKKKFISITLSSLISIGLIISYLLIFFKYQSDVIGNLSTLKSLASSDSIFEILNKFLIPSQSYLMGIKIPAFIFYPIVLILFFLVGVALKIDSSYLKVVRYFSIHLIIASGIWMVYFSYSYRNALFIYAIIIILASIGLSRYFQEGFQFKTFENYPEVNLRIILRELKNKIIKKIHKTGAIFALFFVSSLLY